MLFSAIAGYTDTATRFPPYFHSWIWSFHAAMTGAEAVLNRLGQTVHAIDVGGSDGSYVMEVPLSHLAIGNYLVEIRAEQQRTLVAIRIK